MTYLAFKYKLKPTEVQKEELARMAGCGRFLWNYFLDLNQKKYASEKKFMFYPEMNLNLTQIKKHDMPLAKRQMTCDGCGLDISRDLNAAINIRNWSWLELTKNTAGTAGINACGVTSDGPDEYSSGSYVAMRQEKLCAIGTEARTL